MKLDPTTTAVLFVEAQNGLLGPDSKMKSLAKPAQAAIPHMGRLAHGARAAGVQVVHLTYVPAAGNRSSNRRPPLNQRLQDSLAEWTPDSEAVQPIPEIGVGPDDLVLARNTGLSPTYGTETFKLLRNMGIETIVLAGISANIAIPVAATEAADEDFNVIVARDAVGGAPPEHVESMMQHTLPFVATVLTVDEVLASWPAPARTNYGRSSAKRGT
jgi:nicotinamidase-related amidase